MRSDPQPVPEADLVKLKDPETVQEFIDDPRVLVDLWDGAAGYVLVPYQFLDELYARDSEATTIYEMASNDPNFQSRKWYKNYVIEHGPNKGKHLSEFKFEVDGTIYWELFDSKDMHAIPVYSKDDTRGSAASLGSLLDKDSFNVDLK